MFKKYVQICHGIDLDDNFLSIGKDHDPGWVTIIAVIIMEESPTVVVATKEIPKRKEKGTSQSDRIPHCPENWDMILEVMSWKLGHDFMS